MRISSQARIAAEQAVRRAAGGRKQVRLPHRYGQVMTTAASIVIGAVAGSVWARVAADQPWLLILGLAAVGGAALGYLVGALSQLAAHFLLKQWYWLLTRRWQHVRGHSAERAIDALQERKDDPQALANIGIAHYLLGNTNKAVGYLTQARERTDGSPDLLNALAAAQAAQGHWAQAAELLSRSVQLQANHPATLANLATLLATIPAGSELPTALSSALLTAGPRALNNLAVREMRADNVQAAAGHLHQALAQRAHYPHAQANLGVLAFGEDDLHAAAVNLTAAAQSGGNNPDILSNLGAILTMGGDLTRAEAVLKQAQRSQPARGPAASNEGCLQVELGQYREAIDQFQTVPADKPIATVARHNTAWAYAALGEYQLAREYELQAREARPADPDICITLGAIEWELGNYEQARLHFQSVLELVPDNFRAAISLARIQLSAGHEQAALQILKSLQQDHPDDVQVTFDLGVAHLMDAVHRFKGDMNRTEWQLFLNAVRASIEAFEGVVARAEGMVGEAEVNLGLAYYLRKEPEIAAYHFREAAKLLPEQTDVYFCAGTALAQEATRIQQHHEGPPSELAPQARHLLQQARTHLKRAAADTHAGPDVLCNLGLVYYQLDQIDEATKALRRLVQVDPTSETHNDLALVYAKHGLHIYRRSRVGPAPEDIKRHSLLEQARRLLSTAIHYFSEALRTAHLNPVLHSNIGLAYMIRNRPADVEQALYHWQLMRRTGGEWGERQFQRMLEFMHSEQSAKAEFDDIHMALRSINITESIRGLPPLRGELLYVVEPVMDRGQWDLAATDPDVQTALRACRKVFALQQRLQRLAV